MRRHCNIPYEIGGPNVLGNISNDSTPRNVEAITEPIPLRSALSVDSDLVIAASISIRVGQEAMF
jgi:hypothetical protein